MIGFVTAAITDRTRRRAHAIVLLSQIPKEVTEKLVKILMAHKNRDTDEINSIVCAIGYSKLEQLCELIGPDNRPVHLSSGNFGDNLSWTAMENSLQKQGYTINSSKIITGIMLNNLDVVLKEINKKNK